MPCFDVASFIEWRVEGEREVVQHILGGEAGVVFINVRTRFVTPTTNKTTTITDFSLALTSATYLHFGKQCCVSGIIIIIEAA
jgi:hypothetical protein